VISLLVAWAALVGAVALYALAPSLRIHMSYPWPVYALLVSAIGVAVASRRRGWLRGVTIGAISVVAVMFSYYTLVYSDLDGRRLAVDVGDRFPEFTLETSTGERFSSSETIGKSAALYVFYRGDW